MANFYLQKYGYSEELIKTMPSEELGIIVVIPCFNEPDLLSTLKSIAYCDKPICAVEIIVVINEAENADDAVRIQNKQSFQQAMDFVKGNSKTYTYYIQHSILPSKDAGVGLARKIGMDEAVRRFEKVKNHKGIVVCLDADCLVDQNYLVEIEKHFSLHPKSPGASIYFEHPTFAQALLGMPATGASAERLSHTHYGSEIYNGIILYELFLRYYVNALRFAAHPYAFQTIGSSMAVRSAAYQAQGGMNKRKAGEDFYFLQKIIALENFTEINTTRVLASPRISNRVPFGTGRAMGDWVNGKHILFYDFRIFVALKKFIDSSRDLYAVQQMEHYLVLLPDCISTFLTQYKFEEVVKEIKSNTSTFENFQKRFFHWFNGFIVLKYVHYASEHFFKRVNALEAVNALLLSIKQQSTFQEEKDALLFLRLYDKSKRNLP